MGNFKLTREEKLKSRKVIAKIFKSGQRVSQYPLRFLFIPVDHPDLQTPVLFTCTAPKKKFPKAVDRNKIKRKIREAYRLNKHLLFEPLQQKELSLALLIIYTGKEITSYRTIDKALRKGMKKLIKNNTPMEYSTN